jgi:hypothetical protein
MLDNLDPNEPRLPKTRETPAESRPLADREVPLTGRAGAASLHAWLDGEMPESAARVGDVTRDVDFWVRLEGDLKARRQMSAPADLQSRIMSAIGTASPAAASKWYAKNVTMTVSMAAATSIGLFLFGLLAGVAIYYAR